MQKQKLSRNKYLNGIKIRVSDLGSILDRVIPKTQKLAFNAASLNTQHYKVRIKGKWSIPGKYVGPSLTLRCSSYWKGNLRITFDSGRPIYFII